MQKVMTYLYSELKPMFKLEYLGSDIIASISVAIIGIPLSLAVAIASGVSPSIGLISAIIGGILGAIFGGSRLGVTGPAVAMSVLIANCVQIYGFHSLLIIGIICGTLQIIFGVFNLGRFARLVPLSLVLAFTAGIGFLLFFSQLPHAFNIVTQPEVNPVIAVLSNLNLYVNKVNSIPFAIVILTILMLKFIPKFIPKAPSFLLAVVVPTLIVYFGHLSQVPTVGDIPHNLLHTEVVEINHIHAWQNILVTSLEVFLLASLETLLASNALDLMGKGDLHNPNQELIGQGIANIGVAVFGGIPVTSVIARSSVNVIAGAKTRRSAIFQSLIIAAVIFGCPEIIEVIPTAVLVGILIAAAITMMNFREVVDLWKTSKLEVVVYAITFLSIVATDLLAGIQTGLLAAFAIVGFRMLNTKANIKLWTNKNVLRVSLTGNITFWSHEKLLQIKEFATSQEGLQFVIFEFAKLQNIDATGANHLVEIAKELQLARIQVIFHGLSDAQQNIIDNICVDKPYTMTLTESEIKATLETHGVTHSASDVLKHGMVKFMSEYATDNKRLLTTLAKGQKPHTLLITCSDSRLDPNAFFGSSIGELFIVRNVGNVVPPFAPQWIYSEVAAIEFALNELEVRNIVLCAHTECGAIKASISENKKLSNVGLNNWLSLIQDGFKEHKPLNTDMGVKINLLHQVNNLKTYPSVDKLLKTQELTINAWIYDVHSGHMLEWVEEKHDFSQLV